MRSLLLLAALLCAPLGLPAQSLQLADGSVLVAIVDDADGQGVRCRRLDNGGALELRWDQLSAACGLAIKRQHNLVGDQQDELLVPADEVEFTVNGGKQAVVGKLEDDGGNTVSVVQKGVPFRIPRHTLLGRRTVQVPVAQVYTKDEFYQLWSAKIAPEQEADRHVLLAEDLIKVRDYDHAGEHLAKAKELKNSRAPERIDALLERLGRYREAAKERELLDQIQAARSRGQLADFEKGGKLMAQFEKDFPQSKLRSEFDLEKKRYTDARQRFLAQQVAETFRRSIGVLCDKKAGDTTVTLQAAREYAESKLTDEIVARIAAQFRIDATEVKQLWADRAKFPVGKRTEHFAYGLGSWVLGDKGVVKDTQAGRDSQKREAEAAKDDPNDRDVQRVAKAMRQAFERRRAQQGAGGPETEVSDEDWWRQAARADRASWLRAYYAESGGQLVVTFATVSPCISCYGEGSTPDVAPDGSMIRNKCFVCHGTKYLRSFKAY
jgi:hypothetical protein